MEYKKIKIKKWKDDLTRTTAERNREFDYLEWIGKDAVFQAPDSSAGKTILDRRREREG